MIIEIDNREKELYNILLEKLYLYKQDGKCENIELELKTLHLGDIIIRNDDEIVIIERKTLNDLACSLKDGRYKEQGYRLNNCNLENHNIYYLIEGDINKYSSKYSKVDYRTLLSTITSLSYFKGFSIYKTNNLNESVEWIINLSKKIKIELDKNNKGYYTKNSEKVVYNKESNDNKYAKVLSHRIKKNNISLTNINEIMLSQIPDVSVDTASVIMTKYKTFGNLIKHLELSETALDNIYLTTKTGNKRKISKRSKDNIYNFILQKI